MAANLTADGHRIIDFGGLMFGDRFRFVGDLQGTSYGPVVETQDYVNACFSVDTKDGRHFYGGMFQKVALIHRAPGCTDCGRHVDLCEGCESPWPVELEELWDWKLTSYSAR